MLVSTAPQEERPYDHPKYIGMDVHKESISIAVRNAAGKVVMECIVETKANMIQQFAKARN